MFSVYFRYIHSRIMRFRRIAQVTENGEVSFKVDALRSILLQEKCVKKYPVVLSIFGIDATCQTHFISDSIKYLRGDYHSIGFGELAWIDDASGDDNEEIYDLEPADDYTNGLYLSSEPISEYEIANWKTAVIFLMRAHVQEGSHYRSARSKIFTLSMLLSSVQTVNFQHKVTTAEFDDLQTLIEYSRFALFETRDDLRLSVPFQKLVILVSDSLNHQCYDYGENGGKHYLEMFCQKNSDVAECFAENFTEETQCFLLPPLNGNHFGRHFFKNHLANFTEMIFRSAKTTSQASCSINAKEPSTAVKCTDLLDYAMRLATHLQINETFNNANLAKNRLSQCSPYQLAAHLDLYHLRDQLMKLYRQNMLSSLAKVRSNEASYADLANIHANTRNDILSALSHSTKLSRDWLQIDRMVYSIDGEMMEFLQLYSESDALENARLTEICVTLKQDLEAASQQSQKPSAIDTAQDLKIVDAELSNCYWKDDTFVFNDGTVCTNHGIKKKGERYQEAWSLFKKTTYGQLLRDQTTTTKRNPKSFLCSSISLRFLPADSVLL